MIDDPIALIAAYSACSASLSALMTKVSPTVGPRLRHLFATSAPMAFVFTYLYEGGETIVLHGSDLLVGSGLLAAGLASSVLGGRLTRKRDGKAIRA